MLVSISPIRLNVRSCMHKEGRIKLRQFGQTHPESKLNRAELQTQVFFLLSGVFIELPGDKGSAVIVLHKCFIVLCSVCSGQLFFPLLLSFPQILCLETQTWACVRRCTHRDVLMSAEAVGRRLAVAAGGAVARLP